MKLGYNVDARKRAVNLSLNEDLLARVREVTENLSSVVESLLAEYLARERQRRASQVKIVDSTVAMWNQFAAETGSFADDHSTLCWLSSTSIAIRDDIATAFRSSSSYSRPYTTTTVAGSWCRWSTNHRFRRLPIPASIRLSGSRASRSSCIRSRSYPSQKRILGNESDRWRKRAIRSSLPLMSC